MQRRSNFDFSRSVNEFRFHGISNDYLKERLVKQENELKDFVSLTFADALCR